MCFQMNRSQIPLSQMNVVSNEMVSIVCTPLDTRPNQRKFHSCALCWQVSRRELFVKLPSLPLALGIAFLQSFPNIHDHKIGSEQRPILKLTALQCLKPPVVSRQNDKLMHNCVCFTNLCSISLIRLPSFVNNTPKYLIVSTCWSIMLFTCYLQRTPTWVSGETKCIALFSANFHSGFVILSRKPIKCMLNTVFRVCKQYHITCNMQTVDPATSKRKPSSTGFEYLSNSY